MVEDKEVVSVIVPSAVALAALLLFVLGLALTQIPASRQAEDKGVEGIAKLSGHSNVMNMIVIVLAINVIQALIVSAMGIFSLWDSVELNIRWPIVFFLGTLAWTGAFTLAVVALVMLRYRT